MVVDRLGRFGAVVGRCGSLWIVLGHFGSFWVVPRFSNYGFCVRIMFLYHGTKFQVRNLFSAVDVSQKLDIWFRAAVV